MPPRSLDEIFASIQNADEAQGAKDRLSLIGQQLQKAAHRPWVTALGGLNTPRSVGLWIPEMIVRAGGTPALGVAGEPGAEIDWDDIVRSQPELVVVMPCGETLAQAADHIRANAHRSEWDDLPATHLNQIYAVDPHWFCVPGAGVVQGIEILAGLLHPHLCRHPLETEARRLTLDVRY